MDACEKIIDIGFITEAKDNADFTENSTLTTLMQKFLKYEKDFVKLSTHSAWTSNAYIHIIPALGKKRIKDIAIQDIQDFILYLHKNGRKDGTGGLSVKTIRDIICPLRGALEYAFRRGVITKLDWGIIQYPKDHSPDRVTALSKEQQQELVQMIYLECNSKSVGIALMLFTGLRVGEVCGLQFKDISLLNNTISINKTVQRYYNCVSGKTKVNIGEPKTEDSVREVPIPRLLTNLIKQVITGKEKPDNFFLTGTKKPYEPRTYRDWFNRRTEKAGLPHIKMHTLRHTFATRAIEMPEFDIKSLSEILGHKNVSFTLNVYGRANLQQKRKCMELMNDLL